MRKLRKYRITIEDESHLRTMASVRAGFPALVAVCLAIIIIGAGLSTVLIMCSPLRTLLPGYLDDSQRVATEENLLRLDSLREKYADTQDYIDNVMRVLDTGRVPAEPATSGAAQGTFSPDSLWGPSPLETEFVNGMKDKEKYNISVLAPLAADGMLFSPISPEGVFTMESRKAERGNVLTRGDSPVQAAADGSVVAAYFSWTTGGYELVIQHDRGFMTAYSQVGAPLVADGDMVSSGQAVALAPEPDKNGRRSFSVRMWHDGLPVIPYDYVGEKN